MKTALKLLGAGVAVFVALFVIVGLVSPSRVSTRVSPVQPAPSFSSTTSVPAVSVLVGPLSEFGNGAYEVGADIKPGKYKTTGPDGSSYMSSCYWTRAKDSSGTFDATIAIGTVQGPGIVNINKGEIFQTQGGCTWKLSP